MLVRKPLRGKLVFAGAPGRSRGRLEWRDPRVDALIDSYVEWREECDAVEAAYERWVESERPGRDLSYAAYRASVDREEKAATVYELASIRLVGTAGGTREQF